MNETFNIKEVAEYLKCSISGIRNLVRSKSIPNFRVGNRLDVFGGSGSTLIACEQTNRNCYAMELEPKWVDVIIERWENFTGEKAIKLN